MASDEQAEQGAIPIIKSSDVDARWFPASHEIKRRHRNERHKTALLSAEKALWLIEVLKNVEIKTGRAASVDDLATEMREAPKSVARKLLDMERDGIIRRKYFSKRLYCMPNPALPAVSRAAVDADLSVEEIEDFVLSKITKKHGIPSKASNLSRSTPKTEKHIAQVTEAANITRMNDYIRCYTALRDEIWDSCNMEIPDREAHRLTTYVHQFLVAVTHTNEWVTRMTLIKKFGYSQSTATKMPQSLQSFGLVEIDPRGKDNPDTRYRLSPDFLARWHSRLLPLGYSFGPQPTPGTNPSSNAPSTSGQASQQ